MSATDLEPDPIEARANDLYWDSDASVNDIADELDLSKGSLYAMIHPLTADLTCPECGNVLAYANRTARDKDMLTCSSCGLEESASLVLSAVDDSPVVPPPSYAHERLPGGRAVLATALLGAAAGLLLVRWVRKR